MVLDEQMRLLRKELLMEMIDNKILMSEASTMFDMEKLSEVLYENFKENFPDEEQLQQAMAQEGMTAEDVKQWLLEENAPQEVLINEVGARVSVSDKELQEYYDEHKDEFVMPAEVTIREIVLLADSEAAREKRRAEAEEARGRAVAAEDFAAVARDVSEAGTAAEGGVLGPLKHGELSEQLEELAFSLPVGEISELLEMPYGFHIIKIDQRVEERIAPMDEIGEQLRACGRRSRAERLRFLEARSALRDRSPGDHRRRGGARPPAQPGGRASRCRARAFRATNTR